MEKRLIKKNKNFFYIFKSTVHFINKVDNKKKMF